MSAWRVIVRCANPGCRRAHRLAGRPAERALTTGYLFRCECNQIQIALATLPHATIVEVDRG